MREIKFRAWDKAHGRYVSHPEDFAINLNGKLVYSEDGGIGEFPEHPFIFEQFTGLHDSNGKEIYEGDILKGEEWYDCKPYAVEWNSPSFSLGHDHGLHTIIGNIHENFGMIARHDVERKPE